MVGDVYRVNTYVNNYLIKNMFPINMYFKPLETDWIMYLVVEYNCVEEGASS